MAKFKGITGNKVGRLGNEIYYMNRTVNLIRSAPTHVYDPKSMKQMIQRIKMVNTTNGYKYIQRFNDLDLFPDKKELENQQNVFVKLNIENALLVPKELCKKKNVPMFTLDLIMSNGPFASPSMNGYGGFDDVLGLIIDSVDPQGETQTVGQVSEKLLSFYPTLENGDKIVFYVYATRDIESVEEEDVIVKYEDREVLQTYGQRTIFTIDTNNTGPIFNEGCYCSNDRVLTVKIINTNYNWLHAVENKYTVWMTATFIHKPNTEQQKIGVSGFGYSKGYYDICNKLSNNQEAQLKIIEEWGANMNYNKEIH